MQHMREEIRVEAPVEHVWRFFCDTSRWADWMPRARTSDFSGPVDEAGTTYVQSVRLMGFEQSGTIKVVEIEPERLYHEQSDMWSMDNYFRFEPDGDATNVVMESDYEMPGKLPGFIKDLLASGWMERNHRQIMADFKALAEAKVPANA